MCCSKKRLRSFARTPPTEGFARRFLLTSYVGAGKTAEAIALATELVRAAREQFTAGSAELAAALADTGKLLVDAKAYADAEPLLLESRSLGDKPALPLEQLIRLYDEWGKPLEAAKWRKEREDAWGE